MDSGQFGQATQPTCSRSSSNGFTFQPGGLQPPAAPFPFSPNTQQQLSLGSPPNFGQQPFPGQLGQEGFMWPEGVNFDGDTSFLFEQAMSNQQQQLPPPPLPLLPSQQQQQLSRPPPFRPPPRFHPYGTQSMGAPPAWGRQPLSQPHSPASIKSPPAQASTPSNRPSPAHSTPKLPVTYPEASTPLTILPSPAPTKLAPTPRPPPRPRPSTRLKRSHSFSGTPGVPRSSESKLDALFALLDEQEWSLGEMLGALSELPTDAEGRDVRSKEHVRRMKEFLGKQARVGVQEDEVKGPEEVARLWTETEGDDGKGSSKSLETAVNALYQRMGESHGSAIRNILTRDGVPYEESPTDIQMLDATLSRPPSPRSFKARDRTVSTPSASAAFTGPLVLPSTQADILGQWLMAPGRPALSDEKDSITPDHMRIYSSLSPLELHARGAELCRVILTRDRGSKAQFGQHVNDLERLVIGPIITPSKRCAFHEYDDYSLWHHSLMIYLQLCTRYPTFRESKDATIHLAPDISTLPPSALESTLIERALHTHWDSFRLYLMEEGGLLRSAVRSFAGVGGGAKIRPMDLMLICDDTGVVLKALKKSLKEPSERILPYDPLVSPARNEWRQTAFWSQNSHFVGWSAATTHFLEISALYPRFSEGVRELPLLEKLLGGAAQ